MSTETQEIAGTPAPVESETQNTEQNTPAVTATDGSVEPKQEEQKPKTFTQAEVDALVQKRLLKEQRRITRQLSERQAPLQEPKREQFRDDDAFVQAQIEHIAEQKAAEKLAERDRAMQAEKQADTFTEKAEKAIEKYPDFNDVISNPALPINENMVEFITESDMGADVAYFLGKNPGKAVAIAQMSPVKAALALDAIARELSAKPQPRTTSAPAPISPIGASKATSKEPEDMSFDEFSAWRRNQIKSRS